jgi:drug/metabolite transporter (DMT)-like permease
VLLDTTAVGIALGVVVVVLYTTAKVWRQKSFDLTDLPVILVVFLAVFSVPGGVVLIAAGVSGRPEDLPTSWRQYVALAGIVTMGFALRYLWQAVQSVWPGKATPATEVKEPNEP